MSQSALGSRLGISGPAVAKLERAESHGGITLAKLDEVARSLDCTLVYALVPNSTLQATVEHQARRVARNQLEYVEATMGLESQALGSEQQAEYLDRYTQELVGRHDLWRTEPVLALNSGADDDT
jgi:predicted DNA-binding mobile mystery protein A